MTATPTTPGYAHTQTAPLCLMLYAVGIAAVILALLTGDSPGIIIAGTVGSVMLLLAPCVHHLTIEDRGAVLAIRFGPVPLFRRTLKYADIGSVEIGRTLLVDGWGIHYSVRGGWVWNLWGRTCVVVHFKDGGTLRIGTDDGENLAGFLASKIGHQGV
jgi:hypothetical protein